MFHIIRKNVFPASLVGAIGAITYRSYQTYNHKYSFSVFSNLFNNPQIKKLVQTEHKQKSKIELLGIKPLQYIERVHLDYALLNAIIKNHFTNKYIVVYGTKGSGKTLTVERRLRGYLSTYKIVISSQSDINKSMCLIANKLVDELNKLNPNQQRKNVNSKTTVLDVIELLKEFHTKKYYQPKFMFDFSVESTDEKMYEQVKQMAKELKPYCDVIIVLPNLPVNYPGDPSEFYINVDDKKYQLSYWETHRFFKSLNKDFDLTQEQYDQIVKQGNLTPARLIEISNDLIKGKV